MIQSGVHTIIGCRNESLGNEAVGQLRSQGLNAVECRALDISDRESIQSFASSIQKDFDHLDILVNNAAIAFKAADPTPFSQQARPTVHTNYFGTLWITEALLPLLDRSSGGRIVNVASQAGHLKILRSDTLRDTFTSPSLTVDQLNELMKDFVDDVERGAHDQRGWPNTCYGTSKLAVIALTKILAREHSNLIVNACCPGYCATDMSSHKGPRSAEKGSETPFYLATEATKSGDFYYDNEILAW